MWEVQYFIQQKQHTKYCGTILHLKHIDSSTRVIINFKKYNFWISPEYIVYFNQCKTNDDPREFEFYDGILTFLKDNCRFYKCYVYKR